MKRKLPKEFIDNQFKPKLTDKEFNKLVMMVSNETDIIKVYEFLNRKFDDNRTKWANLKRALKKAKKLSIDNG